MLPVSLLGDGLAVPCVDGDERPYVNLDAAASTTALDAVARSVEGFSVVLECASGSGVQVAPGNGRLRACARCCVTLAGRGPDRDEVVIICRNTTEVINHLAYRLRPGS